VKRLITRTAVVFVLVAPTYALVPSTSRAAERPVIVISGTLESAATHAMDLARAVAMSVIAVAFAAAAVVLASRRDFREAVGAFAVGVVSVLFASPAGMTLIKSTVTSIFG